jgi:hypothetical protein
MSAYLKIAAFRAQGRLSQLSANTYHSLRCSNFQFLSLLDHFVSDG